jgi:plastocyanin
VRTNRIWKTAAVLAVASIAIAAAACGGGSGYGGSSDNSTQAPAAAAPTSAPTTANLAGGAGGGAQMKVTAQDFSFDPDEIKADKGANVEIDFKNAGAATHTFTVYSDDAFTQPVAGADSGRVSGGGTATVKFAAGDEDLYFRCEIHPTQMHGEISVD